ncbi:DUF533 domain-containing protein [Pseudomonas sp. NPDC087358]|uniref:DUF533 domain-containing protein n=1 Tax=Pseudomonas sp. NPDC087358 TaxID=3364439 RepID=UPI00384C9B7F
MNTSDLLEQLLRASQGTSTQQGTGTGAQTGQGGLGGLLGGLLRGGASSGASGGGLGGLLGAILGGGSTGSVAGGAQTRSGSGSQYAMLASLGMMAFKAYQAWQQQQASAPQQAARTVDQLAGPEAENHSHAILRALIAAAKADGKVDEKEHRIIAAELSRHTDDPALQQWMENELGKPLDAVEVAQQANGEPGMAAEMYLASVLLVDDQQDAERRYLDELAAALHIDAQLQVHLEQQAKTDVA